MATYTGYDGILKIADATTGGSDSESALAMVAIGNLRNFSIEQSQDAVEVTSMGDAGYRTYQPGLSTFTLSGDVYFDGTDSATNPHLKLDEMVSRTGGEQLATFEAYPSGNASSVGNVKLSGSCIITSFSITSSVDGLVEASFSAQGSGALTTVTAP